MFYQTYHRRETDPLIYLCRDLFARFYPHFLFFRLFRGLFRESSIKRDDRYNAKHSIGDNFEEKEIFPRICD